MSYVEHANRILDFLAGMRTAEGRIPLISNVDLLRATTERNPSDNAVAYGQANSLLDIASLEADLPLIGRMVVYDRPIDDGPWAAWRPFRRLIYDIAPRLKHWSDADIEAVRNKLRPGQPGRLWREMEGASKAWLYRALEVAQQVIQAHVDDILEGPSSLGRRSTKSD